MSGEARLESGADEFRVDQAYILARPLVTYLGAGMQHL